MALVMPDDPIDTERWYRIQHHHRWYDILACCRSCATRKLHAWTNKYGISTRACPKWLKPLDGTPCEVRIAGIGQCDLVIESHKQDSRGRLVHRRGLVQWNGDSSENVSIA